MFTKTRFDSLQLPDSIMQGITSLGWECLTEVQRDTLPLARQGRDVIGQARTGSGKTAAFGIPILERCQPTGSLQGMVLAPTRELAQQVAEEMTLLQGDQGLSIMTVYGGTDLEKQARGLESGIDVIVGTPGRVMDMSERGHLDLSKIEIFCLDEADRMLDMGFLPDILWILERTTSREQTLLFSATFPQEILDAANEFTNNPEFVMTNQEELDVPPIDLYRISIGRANKLWALGRLLVRMGDNDQCIIFCNTKRMVDLAVQRLQKHRFDVAGLHGDLKQNQRERILDKFREGNVRTIVATDVAARGIDIDGITLVINYDVPSDIDSFIHRIGRTGRIGRHGAAWSLVSRWGKLLQDTIFRARNQMPPICLKVLTEILFVNKTIMARMPMFMALSTFVSMLMRALSVHRCKLHRGLNSTCDAMHSLLATFDSRIIRPLSQFTAVS
ncbi:MAG: DEAD/DEAH box helicase [Candidatus Poseidoniaceae archaeon]|nr:DEAD/DEAH box helicase [Candidatus Poseidoniaceae archaeon]